VNPIQVVFTVPEDKVSDLVLKLNEAQKAGKKLVVEAWDRSNKNRLASGFLVSLDNQIDATSGTIKVKGQFKNESGLLFPNQFVNVRLYSHKLHDAVILPSAAIQHGSIGSFVYVVDGEGINTTVKVQPVETGVVNNNNVQIVTGVAEQDVVVVSGIDKLRDGAKVKVAQKDSTDIGGDQWSSLSEKGSKGPKKSPRDLENTKADKASGFKALHAKSAGLR
jgi:multidrug efflux system membrane fusion protein